MENKSAKGQLFKIEIFIRKLEKKLCKNLYLIILFCLLFWFRGNAIYDFFLLFLGHRLFSLFFSKSKWQIDCHTAFFLELPFRVDHYLCFELMQMRYSVCLNLPSSSWFFFLFFSNKAFWCMLNVDWSKSTRTDTTAVSN